MNIAFEALLPLVEKPSRYIGHEIHSIVKSFDQAKVRVCLVFPDLYELGISHLGLKILYSIINQIDYAMAERAYLPWIDMLDLMRKQNIQLWGLESKRYLIDFDLIGITLQSELCYSNVLELLDLSGVPVYASHREAYHPLVMAGGPCASNPLPLVPFIDVFFMGEAEDAIEDIVNALKICVSRQERLQALARIEGCYVPSIHDEIIRMSPGTKIKVRKYDDFSKSEKIHEPQLLPWQLITHNRYVAEIMRGCSRGCRFCHAGYFYRPVRERDPQAILQSILDEVKTTGWNEAGLVSLSSSDYSCIRPLLKALLSRIDTSKTHISLPSLRVDNLDDDLIHLMRELGREGLTIAPEAGSQRLRDVINKNLDEAEILEGVNTALKLGWQKIKLYFMIGLPFEQNQDIDATIDLIHRICDLSRRKLQINITLSPFVPKAFTPFQYAGFLDNELLLERILRIKNHFRKNHHIKIKYHELESSMLEALLSRGDLQIAELIFKAWSKGAKFDAWRECFDFGIWQEASAGIDLSKYLKERSPDSSQPWSFIDLGISEDFYRAEWEAAAQANTTSDCRTHCANCGICGPNHKMQFTEDNIILTKQESSILEQQHFLEQRSHYRVFYQKLGLLRYISHLDWMRMLFRLIGMVKLPIIYTQGFNPHPKVSLSPPLPVGIQSTCEYFDMTLSREIDLHNILAEFTINKALDITFLSVNALESRKGLDPSSETIRISYPEHLGKHVSDRIALFRASQSYPYTKLKKSIEKNYDLKQIIQDVCFVSGKLEICKKLQGPGLMDMLSSVLDLEKSAIYALELTRVDLK